MDFGIFNLMGAREADKPTAQVFGEVAEQTRLADALCTDERRGHAQARTVFR